MRRAREPAAASRRRLSPAGSTARATSRRAAQRSLLRRRVPATPRGPIRRPPGHTYTASPTRQPQGYGQPYRRAGPALRPALHAAARRGHNDAIAATRPPSPRPRYEPGPPRYDEPADGSYSTREILEAGHGFFGTVSKGLASVVEYAFQKQGRPNGYILGQDAGGAFVAGLRYGEGILYTKDAGSHRVYWQGPSIGYDAGAEGSKVMMLVYNLRDPEEIYQRFGGVDGSAYLVGGVGVTFQKSGTSSSRRSGPASACGSAPTSAISSTRAGRPGTRSERQGDGEHGPDPLARHVGRAACEACRMDAPHPACLLCPCNSGWHVTACRHAPSIGPVRILPQARGPWPNRLAGPLHLSEGFENPATLPPRMRH